MKMLHLAGRNGKEILRDPLTAAFSLGFPLVILVLLTAIQANIPVSMFELPHIAPGIAVFGLSFMTLFSATLIAKDRESALMQRLYTAPLTAADFILAYMLPVLPIALGQSFITYVTAIVLGLEITVSILYALLFIMPISLFFIALGLLCGSCLNVKQVGGICGALLTNVSGFLAGIWFDLELVGGAFKAIAYALPFAHAVELERAVLAENWGAVLPHLLWVLGYGIVTLVLAVFAFLRQMKRQ